MEDFPGRPTLIFGEFEGKTSHEFFYRRLAEGNRRRWRGLDERFRREHLEEKEEKFFKLEPSAGGCQLAVISRKMNVLDRLDQRDKLMGSSKFLRQEIRQLMFQRQHEPDECAQLLL